MDEEVARCTEGEDDVEADSTPDNIEDEWDGEDQEEEDKEGGNDEEGDADVRN